MDKSDVCLMTGSVLVMAALIMWETFGLMITPTVMTVAAAGCFVVAGLCAAREEELKSRKRKRRRTDQSTSAKEITYTFSIRREWRECND